MPVALCSLAASLKKANYSVNIIDAFGNKPNQILPDENFYSRGLKLEETIDSVHPETRAIFLYAISLIGHHSVVKILLKLKDKYPQIPIIILENTQAVTAYSLRKVRQDFYKLGADYVLTGESEERGIQLIDGIVNNTDVSQLEGVGHINKDGVDTYLPPSKDYLNLDNLPFPAYELLPLENYWKLKYSHGPFQTKKYLPLLTSRGCPYPCNFCVIPETNSLKWRSRSAENIVAEIEHFKETLGVTEYHIEDVDPTVSDKRTKEFSSLLIDKKLNIIWKICAGTKVETMRSEETIELMAKSGCNYISISPETGSPKVLKLINKPFKLDHASKIIKKMSKVGISSQACFVLGYPGEEDEDRVMTHDMIKDLTRKGVDEVALFIVTPVPGSSIFDQFSGYQNYSDLNFSPEWRDDYIKLNKFRLALYRKFLIWKFLYHPFKFVKQPFLFLFRKFRTKMEMTPFRALHTLFLLKSS
ncbi:MAG: B12-binding domain-containing radical SAM protein [Bacteriovoracaceae bacterium]|nr:B12-binding domain-containing radical SAM protein [Bacteriovoracaceae bacterium]